MSTFQTFTDSVIDTTNDLIEKVSTPGSRAGSTIERAGRMLEEGVDADVIALQMTKNSASSQKYTKSDVLAYGRVYQDCKTKVVLTSAQTRALIQDQQEASELSGQLT
ncbi:hypothetical protein IB254_00725 [Pseudomonas sp. PDM03]|uniref:hypothetical protein n=1 Tax=Pseudomonas sp. PDM03 TaxID=2769266 RepID=UPI00177D0E07|nr:hypothetical protein [Pseudomonas sp. PDM03]MBD9585567.1 hypothetical protein [Pseudomonas sp. PDM03]